MIQYNVIVSVTVKKAMLVYLMSYVTDPVVSVFILFIVGVLTKKYLIHNFDSVMRPRPPGSQCHCIAEHLQKLEGRKDSCMHTHAPHKYLEILYFNTSA